MHPVAVFDFIFFSACLFCLVILLKGFKRAFRTGTKLLLAGLLLFSLVYSFCLALEWSGISDRLENTEDFVGALLPMWWAFVFYAMVQEMASRELAASEAKYRTLVEQTPLVTYIASLDKLGSRLYISPQVERMLGFEPPRWLTKPGFWTVHLHPDDVERVLNELEASRRANTKFVCEYRMIAKDKHVVWIRDEAVPVADESGKNLFMQGILSDITDRKKAEESLRRSGAKLQSIFRAAPVGIGVVSNRVLLQVNERMCEITGYSSAELTGQSARMLYPTQQEYEHVGTEKYAQISERGTGTVETQWKRKDGEIIDILLSSTPLEPEDLSVGVTFTALDITAHKQAEAVLRRLNRELKAKNKELASILYAASHDLRSPLVNIQGFGYELSRCCDVVWAWLASSDVSSYVSESVDIALRKDIPEALDFILASTVKMNALLSGLLDISRLNAAATDMKRIDMNDLVSNTTSSMEYQIQALSVKVDVEELPSCFGDAAQIGRVFTNLLGNALKFLDSSRTGRIHIYGREEGGQSVYCVEDNGIGIAAKHQGKIFQIFYQLDPTEKKGEGLGLSIVSHIVERHNGKIWVESEVGRGSKFFVSLPSA